MGNLPFDPGVEELPALDRSFLLLTLSFRTVRVVLTPRGFPDPSRGAQTAEILEARREPSCSRRSHGSRILRRLVRAALTLGVEGFTDDPRHTSIRRRGLHG